MDYLLPVLLPCPLCSAQQQMSAQTAAAHLWNQERTKRRHRSNRPSASMNDLSSTKSMKKMTDGVYRAEPYFIENVGDVEVSNRPKMRRGISPYNNDVYDSEKSVTLPAIVRREKYSVNKKADKYSNFLRLCEHVECLVDLSVKKQRRNYAEYLPSKALTRKTRKTLIKENEKGDMNKLVKNSDRQLQRNPRTHLSNTSVTPDIGCNHEVLLSDDLLVRSLRDANNLRSPVPLEGSTLQTFMQVHQNNPKNYYVWTELDKSKYRSRFLPMRNHDLVRDDMAFRSYRKNHHVDSNITNANENSIVAKVQSENHNQIDNSLPNDDGSVSLLLCQKDIYESQEVAVDVDEAIKRCRLDAKSERSINSEVGSQRSQKNSRAMDSVDSLHQYNQRFQNQNSESFHSDSKDHHPHSIVVSSLPPIPPPRRRSRSRSKNQKEDKHPQGHQTSPILTSDQKHSEKKSSHAVRSPQKLKGHSSHASSRQHRGKHHKGEHGKKIQTKNNPIFPDRKLVVRHHSR